jgi:hypothetical protein
MVQTKIWQTTLFQNLILFTNHYGNLQEMLEMASLYLYALYLTSEWSRFYVGHPVYKQKLFQFLSPPNHQTYITELYSYMQPLNWNRVQ